jgi:hypothetical protein
MATCEMKKKILILAVIGGFVCVALTLWPAQGPLYYTAVYAGISVGAVTALLHVERQLRWLAIVALLFGLIGVFVSWPSHARDWAAIRTPNQNPQAGEPRWIQWSSSAGGNNHYYALTPSATNWLTAESLAESWGGTLATITSPEEQNFINDTFLTGKIERLPLWIGLVRTPTNGASNLAGRLRRALADLGFHVSIPAITEFEWVTGEDFAYSNWKPGEPSNNPPGESVVAINWEYATSRPNAVKGNWNDTPINGTTRYGGKSDGPYFGLVEIGPSPGPILTPSRWGLITLAGLALAAVLAFISIKLHTARQ